MSTDDERQARLAEIRRRHRAVEENVAWAGICVTCDEQEPCDAMTLLSELDAATARAERAGAERDRTQEWLDRFQSEAATQQVRAIKAEQCLKKIAAAGYDLKGQAMTFVLSLHVRERHPGEYDDALCGNGTCNSVRKHVAAWKAALRAALAEGA